MPSLGQVAAVALSLIGTSVAWPISPFSKIAAEIRDADQEAKELEWKVANNSDEKDSAQFFLATAIQDLTALKKAMNSSIKGTLANKYQACINRTHNQMPGYNKSLTIHDAFAKDDALAPGMLEAHMSDLYAAQEQERQLTTELGECTARCPSFLLLRGKRGLARALAKAPAPAPAPAPAGPAKKDASEVMKGFADAIYGTSKSIDKLHKTLREDDSAKQIMQTMTSAVMTKLLKAKSDMTKMEEDLQQCEHKPSATKLGDEVGAAMAGDADMALEMVKAAEKQAKDAQEKADAIEKKVADCKKKCG